MKIALINVTSSSRLPLLRWGWKKYIRVILNRIVLSSGFSENVRPHFNQDWSLAPVNPIWVRNVEQPEPRVDIDWHGPPSVPGKRPTFQ
ncbi:unnamed protein product [Allacma fusca]|uniref:Uncharacterized protein n=1 Tax=Allacma fusca TaxID=39272 RepID=A0A8J2NR58_9HEXA|nr:unnamed protein product [Allacma fusca]